MGAVNIGTRLQDFSGSGLPLNSYEQIKRFEPEVKGQTTEGFVCAVLSLFDGVTMRVPSGTALDLKGVDILVRGHGPTLGLQVKSSKGGYESFLSHPSRFYEKILVVWVDIQSWRSRRALLLGLLPVLSPYGINLKPEVVRLIKKREAFVREGVRRLPCVKGVYPGFSKDEVKVLTALGISHLDKGELVV